MSNNIVYGQEQDFKSKLAKFGAVNNNNNKQKTYIPPKNFNAQPKPYINNNQPQKQYNPPLPPKQYNQPQQHQQQYPYHPPQQHQKQPQQQSFQSQQFQQPSYQPQQPQQQYQPQQQQQQQQQQYNKPQQPPSSSYNKPLYNSSNNKKPVTKYSNNQYTNNFSSNANANSSNKARPKRKNLIKSKAARAMGRNEDAIKVNLDSVKNKVKFGRLVVYSVNCLANLAENRFNCEFIVEQEGISALREVMRHHSGNPAAMKEVSRTLKNVAKASPEYADAMANEGLIEQSLNTLVSNPEDCGVYAIQVMDGILSNGSNPKQVANKIVQSGGLKILQDSLKKYANNPELCANIIKHLNHLMAADPSIIHKLGENRAWEPILDAMKKNPTNDKLAIEGTEALQKFAISSPNYLKSIQDYGAVGIISACMQANPDNKQLLQSGAAALKLLAGKDDISRALAVLLNFNKYDDVMITQALGLLGNLALIKENANFIVAKGGMNALIDLIKFKTKKHDLTPEEIAVLANAIRGLGRLLIDPKVCQQFVANGELNKIKEMLEEYDSEETIMNACMDLLGNMSQNPEGRKHVSGSGCVETATNVLYNHEDYDVMMQKYNDLMAQMPLSDAKYMQHLVKDTPILAAIQKSLLANYEDPDTVMAIMNLMSNLVKNDPKLAQGLAENNARGLIQAIRAHEDNPKVLDSILSCVHCIGKADPMALEYLKKIGLENELVKILKQENISDEVAAVIKDFLDKVKADDISVDLTNVLLGLKGLGMPLDELAKTVQEVEVKDEPEEEIIDPNSILKNLTDLNTLLLNPEYAKNYIANGNVGNILDHIQQCYDNPNIVCAALDAIISCSSVPGVFPILEEAGVCEGVVQCMLEHPNNMLVQYKGVCALNRLASHNDPLVSESLCQPITLETALKALQKGLADPNMCDQFANMVCNLMKDQTNAPTTAQALASAGVMDALNTAIGQHGNNPKLVAKLNEALSAIQPYLFNPNDIGVHNANVNPYGSVTMAQIASLSPEEIDDMIGKYDTQTLMTTLRASRDPKMVQSSAKEVNKRLQGNDEEVYNSTVSGGGIGDLLGQANNNMDNPGPLGACLDGLGTLSSDDRLKTLLGMHGTIRLILECMRRHPNDIELLDKCCYILSNLSFNNAQNMTAIVELGGVQDIVGVIKKHTPVNFICESAVNVLVNLCHNSDKNKTLIARSGGAKATIAALKTHNKCLNDGDEAVVVSCFRCLANLAYVPDNVKQLIKLDVVAVVMDTMNQNTDKKDLIQMGVVVLANLSSHERTAARMVHLGVLDLIIRVSESYPDELEIQRSCLGCVGNLMNEQSNAVAFMDKNGHKRIFEIMQELVFEESVISVALKLLKVLATNADIATELTLDGGCKVVAEIMLENKSNEDVLSLGCQALCKLIQTMEAAKHVSKDGLVDIIVEIAKENNNWANIQIMNELVKVVVNFSAVEENAQPYSRNGSVSLLRSIEAHKTNAVYLNNAAMALSKLSVHPAASRSLVKRGAIAVILESMKANDTRKGILTRYIRALTNLLYTEHKAGEEIAKLNGYDIVYQIASKHQNYKQMQDEFKGFEKAVKLKAKHYVPSSSNQIKVRDKMNMTNVRFLCAGTVVRKYDDNKKEKDSKPKKRTIKLNDDCNLLLFEDPTGKKAPKQLNMKSVKAVQPGNNLPGMNKANPSNSFLLVSIDPNGREFKMGLECKTNIEAGKWMEGLNDCINATSTM